MRTKALLVSGLLAFGISGLALANAHCDGINIVSVGHKLCAKVTSINLAIPAGPDSQLNKMHQTFGKTIYHKFQKDVTIDKIPHGVESLIKYIHYDNHTYQCKDVFVKNNILHMEKCAL